MAVGERICLVLLFITASSRAITNLQEPQHYSQLQYQSFADQLNRGVLSPQQQTHILSDVQQHRFHVNQQDRQRQNFQRPQFQPEQQFQLPYQPQYQERKPVLLQPTYSQEQKLNYSPQQGFAQSFQPSVPSQQGQPSFVQPQGFPQYQSFDNFVATEAPKNPFENYVATEKPKVQQYLTEVTQTFTQKPEDTPSWILETQPPNVQRKQKPYEAITFGTESYKTTTHAPRVVKYRPRPQKQEEKYSKENTGEIYIKQDRKKLYEQLVGSQKPVTVKTTPKPVRSTTTEASVPNEQFIQEQLQKQILEQLGGKDDIFKTLKISLPGDLSPDQIANLPNIALGDSVAQVPQLSSSLPQSVYLANGQKIKVVPSAGKSQKKKPIIQASTAKPPTFDEITKGVLPPGADFEVIRQNKDGGLENVGPLSNLQQKKVTFVILEEQPDGSVRVQGVRGNENGPTETKGDEVQNIIDRLQKGEIKLPPSTKLSRPSPNSTPEESQAAPHYVKHIEKSSVKATPAPKKKSTTRTPSYVHTTISSNTHAGPSVPVEDYKRKVSRKPSYSSPPRLSFLPTVSPSASSVDNLPSYSSIPSSTFQPPFSYTPEIVTQSSYSTSGPTYVPTYASPISNQPVQYTEQAPVDPVPTPNAVTALGDILKRNGLFAMARFLKQSGLDMVLNETGPYTLFVPTDRAFRSLLVQLGGPDRAEIKFKENPRLLSGLLLHHVIPGSFKFDSLLDEMTGVSLAGTQLRVNTYTTQDNEWNDVKVVTVNGAKITREKSDIEIPQGVAHTVDRVMFPLPVGDVVQTLQADREARFSKFIKLLQETGVSSMLQGTKTYTVFAPTDSAFTDGELEKLLEQRVSARALALRHITPGTLYSAGMLFYQLRDSMNNANQIQLSKEAGRVKVNNAHVISRNIPATNGVIHAIDSLL